MADTIRYREITNSKITLKQKAKKLVHDEHFEVGDRVIHGKFGEGVVLEVTPKIIRVEFVGNGVKKLAVGIAPIKKM